MAKGIEVVLMEDFEQYKEETQKQIEELREEVKFFRSLLGFASWVRKKEAMELLGCSSTTLWRLQKQGSIEISSVKGSIRYSLASIREYLKSRSVDFQ